MILSIHLKSCSVPLSFYCFLLIFHQFNSVDTPERNESEVIVQVILLKNLISIVGLKNSCVD